MVATIAIVTICLKGYAKGRLARKVMVLLLFFLGDLGWTFGLQVPNLLYMFSMFFGTTFFLYLGVLSRYTFFFLWCRCSRPFF